MPRAAPAITAFNGGEWSPKLEGRVDLDRYGSACRTLENFLPLVQGGVEKRSGFRLVREAVRKTYAASVFSEIFSPATTLAATNVRTGYGFQPKFCLVYATQTSTGTSTARATLQHSVGISDGTSSYCFFGRSGDAQPISVCSAGVTTNVLASFTAAGTAIEGATGVQSFDSGGITFVCNDAYSVTPPACSVWACGGEAISRVEVKLFDTPTSVGEFTVSGTAADAEYDFAIVLANGVDIATPVGRNYSRVCVGMCDSTLAQGISLVAEQDAQDTSNSFGYSALDRCLYLATAATGPWTSLVSATAVRLSGNSLTLNFSSVSSSSLRCAVLFVQSGGAMRVQSFDTPSSTGIFTPFSGLAGTPRGMFYASSGSVNYSMNGQNRMSLCGRSVTTTGSLQAMTSVDIVGTTECAIRVNGGGAEVWGNVSGSSTPTLLGSISHSSTTPTSISLDCTIAGATGRSVIAAIVTDITPVGAPRLVPFVFNEDDAHVLEFGHLYMSVYRDSAPALEGAKDITGATQASPVVITSAGHGFSDNDEVYISGVSGMVQINGGFYTVAGVTSSTFQLSGVDGTAFTAYSSGGTAARRYVITTPYTADDLPTLSWAGQNDVLYIACPRRAPMKLSRFAAADWELSTVAFDYVPFAPENTDENSYVAASAATGSITLTASDALFSSASVGSYIKLREVIETSNAKWKEGTDFPSTQYQSFCSGSAMAVGDRCYNDGKVYELTDKHTGVGTVTGVQAPTHEEGTGFDGRWEWKFLNYGFGYAQVVAFTDAYRVSATVVVPMPQTSVSADIAITSTTAANPVVVTTATHGYETGDKVFLRGIVTADELNDQVYVITRLTATTFSVPVNGTTFGAGTGGQAVRMFNGPVAVATPSKSTLPRSMFRWSWGAWDAVRGYPRAVVFFEDRLFWAGTASNPQTVWTSVTGDYEDHRTFDEDDSALVFTLASSSPIEWMLTTGSLVIGTGGEEFSSNRNATEPLNPGNVDTIRVRSRFGSKRDVRPLGVGTAILMTQRAGRKLREVVFSDTEDSLIGPDMTRLADHITVGILAEMTFQAEPNRIAWGRLESGELIAMTYERNEEVICWHRHPLGGSGLARSLCAIPHPDGDGDQLWAIVERTISGVVRYFVERLEKQWVDGTAIADAFYVDAGVTYSGSAATVIYGGRHLAGQSVQVLADGIDVGTQVVAADGSITLAVAASVVHRGLSFGAVLETLRLEAGAADGTAQGKLQRVTRAVVRLHQTGGNLEYGPDASTFRQTYKVTAGTLTDDDTPVLSWPAGSERGSRIALRHSSPLPCSVLAIFPQLTTTD